VKIIRSIAIQIVFSPILYTNLTCIYILSIGDERGLLQVVLKAKTMASILMETTDKQNNHKKKSGSLSRKLLTAMKALGDFDVFYDWIRCQVYEESEEFEDKSEEEKREEFEK
jgi:hypothetical protein